MKSSILHAIAAMLLLVVPAGARPLGTITEDGRELVASMLTLPSTAIGTLSILGCTACERQTLTLNANTRFYVGPNEVDYSLLRDLVASNPKSAVLVVTPVGTNVVTRIKFSAVTAADLR